MWDRGALVINTAQRHLTKFKNQILRKLKS